MPRAVQDVLLWRRPLHAAVALLIATAVHQHCAGPRGKPFVALLAEVLMALTFCAAAVGHLSKHFNLRYTHTTLRVQALPSQVRAPRRPSPGTRGGALPCPLRPSHDVASACIA